MILKGYKKKPHSNLCVWYEIVRFTQRTATAVEARAAGLNLTDIFLRNNFQKIELLDSGKVLFTLEYDTSAPKTSTKKKSKKTSKSKSRAQFDKHGNILPIPKPEYTPHYDQEGKK